MTAPICLRGPMSQEATNKALCCPRKPVFLHSGAFLFCLLVVLSSGIYLPRIYQQINKPTSNHDDDDLGHRIISVFADDKERQFLFQRLSVVLQRFNACLLAARVVCVCVTTTRTFSRPASLVFFLICLLLSWSAQFGDLPEILPKKPFWDRPGVLADKTVVQSSLNSPHSRAS